MKIILSTPNFEQEHIKNMFYDKETATLSFSYKNKSYTVPVESPLGTYVKVFENDDLELIDNEACIKF
jgi:hypothetical protein